MAEAEEIVEVETVEEIIAEEVTETVGEVAAESEEAEEVVKDNSEVVVVIDEEPQEEAPQWVKDLRKNNRKDKKRIRELEDKLESQSSASKDVELGKKPHPDDYEYGSDQYIKDTEQYIERKRIIDKKAEDKKAEEETQAQAWQSQVDDYGEKKTKLNVKNFDELEDNVKDVLSLTQQGIIIQASENSALIMLALGTNPIKAKEMASITDPVKFAVAIGRMEAKMKVTNRKVETNPEKKIENNGGSNSLLDNNIAKLEAEADKTGDRTKLIKYKRKMKEK